MKPIYFVYNPFKIGISRDSLFFLVHSPYGYPWPVNGAVFKSIENIFIELRPDSIFAAQYEHLSPYRQLLTK